jgi:hypothetical protein
MAKYQKVFLRIVGMVGDKPTDEDKFPDRVMATGTWFLKPNLREGAAENAYGPDGIPELELPNSISGEIVNGMLTYNSDPFVWLRVSEEGWNWQLSFPQLRVDGIAKKLDSWSFDLEAATPEQMADEVYPGINLAPLIEFVNPNTGQKAVKGDTGWSLTQVLLVGDDQLLFRTNNPNPLENELGTITIPTIVQANASAAAALVSEQNADASEAAALAHRNAAETAKGLSETARTGSETARTGSESARDASVTAKTASEGARDAALTHRNDAQTAKTASEAARDASVTAKTASEGARDASVTAKTASEGARDTALTHRNDAQAAKTASEAARDASVTAKTASEGARDTAITKAGEASDSADDAAASAIEAANYVGGVADNAISTAKIQDNAVSIAKIHEDARISIARYPHGFEWWHDVLAFCERVGVPTCEERTTATGVWAAASSTSTGPFAQLDNLKTTLLADSSDKDGYRYIFNNSNLSFSNVQHFMIGFGYNTGTRTVVVTIERSTDGIAWESAGALTTAVSASTIFIPTTTWASFPYMRITFERTVGTGAVIVTTIKALTARKGDQGGGMEYQFPIRWDKDKRLGLGTGGVGTSMVRIGDDSTTQAGGLQFGTDTYLYRDSINTMRSPGIMIATQFRASTTAPAGASDLTRKDYVDTQVGAKYTKPGSGIPSSDMAAAVVTSLGKADTAIQQAGLDAAKLVTINAQTASYTLVLTDGGKAVEVTSASATNVTVPPNSSVAFPVGTVIELTQVGAGKVNIVQGAGVTINNAGSLGTRAQWSSLVLRKRATDTWLLTGDMA